MPEVVQYKNAKNPEKAAMIDLEWWFGKEWPVVLQKCKDVAAKPEVTFRDFQIMLMLAGVEGYPVRVLWEHLGRKDF